MLSQGSPISLRLSVGSAFLRQLGDIPYILSRELCNRTMASAIGLQLEFRGNLSLAAHERIAVRTKMLLLNN